MDSRSRTPTPPGRAADPRRAAVSARDVQADASIVRSVRTTGVYCRPSRNARAARHTPGSIFHDLA